MLGKILDFICTRLRSTEIALDSLSLVQYDFCRTKTRANKIKSRILQNTRGIKHDFPFINIRKVPREVLKTEGPCEC